MATNLVASVWSAATSFQAVQGPFQGAKLPVSQSWPNPCRGVQTERSEQCLTPT